MNIITINLGKRESGKSIEIVENAKRGLRVERFEYRIFIANQSERVTESRNLRKI